MTNYQAEKANRYTVACYDETGTRCLGWHLSAGQLTTDHAKAATMPRAEAEQLAHDLREYAASKGRGSTFSPQAQADTAAADALQEMGFHAGPWNAPTETKTGSDKQKNRFIDMTPTWPQAARIIAAALEHGTDKGRDAARAELFRMADLLDQLQAEQTERQQ